MWPCGWWITAGTRRIRAARRPTNPAFDVCVWTIDGRSCLISLSNWQSAARSSSGASSRPRDGMSTTRHPRLRAPSSEGISDSRKDVASVQSYPARLSATHEAMVFSDEPPSVSRVIAWRTRTLTPALFVRTAPRRVRSEEHTSELQSQSNLVCRLLLEKKKKRGNTLYLDTKKNNTQQTDT